MFTFPVGFFGGSTGDPYWSNVVLYLPFTGTNGQTTFTDVSRYGHTITRNGDTVISTAQAPALTGVSSSAYFDGNGDFLRLPITTLFNFNADFTIDCFVYPVSNSTRQDLIGNYEGSSNGWGIGTNQAGSGNIIFYHGNTILVSTGSVLVLNSWNYLRVVRSASSIQIWVSNTLVGTGSNGSSFYSSRALRVGCIPNVSDSEQLFINAYISHLRITNGIARPNTGIPTAPFPIG